jgi:hypothetical protein
VVQSWCLVRGPCPTPSLFLCVRARANIIRAKYNSTSISQATGTMYMRVMHLSLYFLFLFFHNEVRAQCCRSGAASPHTSAPSFVQHYWSAFPEGKAAVSSRAELGGGQQFQSSEHRPAKKVSITLKFLFF